MSSTLTRYYDPKKKRVLLMPMLLLTELKPKIVCMTMGVNSTQLRMAPEWFKHDDQSESLKGIVYPDGVDKNDQRQFDTIARYRAAIHKPNNNFRKAAFNPSENDTETLIMGLNDFIQQFNGEMSFTDEDLTFNEPADRAACGVADLSSSHLLASNYIPTAQFNFIVDLDYQRDLARSGDAMQDFVLNFSDAIADVLNCKKDYIRVMSVGKPGTNRHQSKVNLGLSTPDPVQTEKYANDLKVNL